MNRSEQRFFHIHLISDATGETLNAVARAAAAQYADYRPIEHIHSLIRTAKQMQRVIAEIDRLPGIVLFTVVDKDLRHQLETHCANAGVPCLSILDPVIASLANYLNAPSKPAIGAQHALNAQYFNRIEALNFAMAHDDGQNTDDLEKADIVILGISRTSKTPTSIYLAQRGFKTANIPIILNINPPILHLKLTKPLVVALTASPERIAQIRRHRLLTLKEGRETAYADARSITDETMYMKRLCIENQWPMIDVTRRSIEETAASIINLLAERNAQEDRN